MNKSNVIVSFDIRGEKFKPLGITEKLKIIPSDCWMQGDVAKGRNVVKQNSFWSINTGYCETDSICEQTDLIIEKLRGKNNTLKELKKELDVSY